MSPIRESFTATCDDPWDDYMKSLEAEFLELKEALLGLLFDFGEPEPLRS